MKRIFVVEQSEAIRRILALLIEGSRRDVELKMFYDAKDAIAQTATSRPDLSIVANNTPGYQTLIDLQEQLGIPTLVLENPLLSKIARTPLVRVVRKPFDTAMLLATVDSVLGPEEPVAPR